MVTAIIVILIAAGVVFGLLRYRKNLRSGCCGSDSDPAAKRIKVQDRDPSHYPYVKILGINGMTCQNCVTHVQNALNSLDGVYSKVDLNSKQAVVRMKEELPDQLLRKTVALVGYTVGSVSASPQSR